MESCLTIDQMNTSLLTQHIFRSHTTSVRAACVWYPRTDIPNHADLRCLRTLGILAFLLGRLRVPARSKQCHRTGAQPGHGGTGSDRTLAVPADSIDPAPCVSAPDFADRSIEVARRNVDGRSHDGAVPSTRSPPARRVSEWRRWVNQTIRQGYGSPHEGKHGSACTRRSGGRLGWCLGG